MRWPCLLRAPASGLCVVTRPAAAVRRRFVFVSGGASQLRRRCGMRCRGGRGALPPALPRAPLARQPRLTCGPPWTAPPSVQRTIGCQIVHCAAKRWCRQAHEGRSPPKSRTSRLRRTEEARCLSPVPASCHRVPRTAGAPTHVVTVDINSDISVISRDTACGQAVRHWIATLRAAASCLKQRKASHGRYLLAWSCAVAGGLRAGP